MFLYVSPDLREAGTIDCPALDATTERHRIVLCRPALRSIRDVATELCRDDAAGVVFELCSGLPSIGQIDAAAAACRLRRRAWFYWPAEQAVEAIDAQRLETFRRHVRYVSWMRRVGLPLHEMTVRADRVRPALRWIYRGEFPVRRSEIESRLDYMIAAAHPVPFQSAPEDVVVCLRTDHWNTPRWDTSTDPFLQALAACQRVVCLTPTREETRGDDGRVRQVGIGVPQPSAGQDALVLASAHYLPIVRTACQTAGAAFLYDRLSLGSYVGAAISQTLRVPYVVEYSGTAAITRAAIQAAPPAYADIYARAEELALRQATALVVPTREVAEALVARGIDSGRIIVGAGAAVGVALQEMALAPLAAASLVATGDADKDRTQAQWNENPVGSHYARGAQPRTLEWFLEVERHRYREYAPWMPDLMEFAAHAGEEVLEIGGGLGTDLAQFAARGAHVTDVDLSAGHLALAEDNFRARRLSGRFIHHDAESLPFAEASFDLAYSNGVLHHTPNTGAVIAEIHRVLRPGGRAIVMLYAENSWHYWRQLVWALGIRDGQLRDASMGEIMSRAVERSANGAKPLVKVYTPTTAAALFADFDDVRVVQRQLAASELPRWLRPMRAPLERRAGWNLIVKARKPSGVRH